MFMWDTCKLLRETILTQTQIGIIAKETSHWIFFFNQTTIGDERSPITVCIVQYKQTPLVGVSLSLSLPLFAVYQDINVSKCPKKFPTPFPFWPLLAVTTPSHSALNKTTLFAWNPVFISVGFAFLTLHACPPLWAVIPYSHFPACRRLLVRWYVKIFGYDFCFNISWKWIQAAVRASKTPSGQEPGRVLHMYLSLLWSGVDVHVPSCMFLIAWSAIVHMIVWWQADEGHIRWAEYQ